MPTGVWTTCCGAAGKPGGNGEDEPRPAALGECGLLDIDGEGRRVGKKVDGVVVRGWLYSDALTPAAELDGDGNVVARFFPGGMIKGGRTYRIVTDHLGSPRLVLDAETGEVAQRMAHDEFGRVLLDTNPGFTPFGFAGGLYDPDTGLVRFGARDYEPETGRWTTRDPILFSGGQANLYAYVDGDPVNRIDPLGWAEFPGSPFDPYPIPVPLVSYTGPIHVPDFSPAVCFLKGVGVGAGGAVAVAGVAAAAGYVGVPVGVITVALGASAAVGGGVAGLDIGINYSAGNWNAVAYNVGSVVGGIGGGRARAYAVPGVNKDSPFRLFEWDKLYNPQFGTVGQWFATGPTPSSATGSTAAAGTGAAAAMGGSCGCN